MVTDCQVIGEDGRTELIGDQEERDFHLLDEKGRKKWEKGEEGPKYLDPNKYQVIFCFGVKFRAYLAIPPFRSAQA